MSTAEHAALDVDSLRAEFPALARRGGGRSAAYFDGPGGSQVPRAVIDAMAAYLEGSNANAGGAFASSRETDALLAPYGDWGGLASVYLLAGHARGLVPLTDGRLAA